MRLPPYSEYKPSGIEWLGEVPEHWDVKRLKMAAHLTDRKIEADEELPVPYVGMENIESWTGRLLPINPNVVPTGTANEFKAGNTLFGKLRPYLAKACNPDFDGLCSTELLVLQGSDIDRRALLYSLLSDGFIKLVDSATYGSKMPRASWDFVGNCVLPIAPSNEQRPIANFLDRETAKIDTLVAKKRTLIERLKEKRTALITRTVTRGLPPDAATRAGIDPHPKFKPSGVEWLGEVPEHWEVKRLKYSTSINDEALPETTDPGFEMSYVDISSVDQIRGIVTVEDMVFEDAPSRARRVVRDEDTIVSTVRTYLRAIAPVSNPASNTIVSTGFAVVRPRRVSPAFLSCALRETGLIDAIVARSVGVSYPAVNASEIGTLPIPLPAADEQRAIAAFLDRETVKIDVLVAKIETAIERLQEYRTALITAAVTGKIDVREAAA